MWSQQQNGVMQYFASTKDAQLKSVLRFAPKKEWCSCKAELWRGLFSSRRPSRLPPPIHLSYGYHVFRFEKSKRQKVKKRVNTIKKTTFPSSNVIFTSERVYVIGQGNRPQMEKCHASSEGREVSPHGPERAHMRTTREERNRQKERKKDRYVDRLREREGERKKCRCRGRDSSPIFSLFVYFPLSFAINNGEKRRNKKKTRRSEKKNRWIYNKNIWFRHLAQFNDVMTPLREPMAGLVGEGTCPGRGKRRNEGHKTPLLQIVIGPFLLVE